MAEEYILFEFSLIGLIVIYMYISHKTKMAFIDADYHNLLYTTFHEAIPLTILCDVEHIMQLVDHNTKHRTNTREMAAMARL